jgi:hypothetical protein
MLMAAIVRFKFLLSHLRFDNAGIREQAKKRDKFAPAREILTLFNLACAKAMQCGTSLTVDETLYPNRGRGFTFK